MQDEDQSGKRISAIERALSRPFAKIALDPDLESEYQGRTDRQRRTTIAGWQLAAVLANLACLPLDYLVGQLELGLTLRLGLVTPLYLLGILVLYRGTRGAQNAAVVLPLVCFAAVVTFLGVQVDSPHSDRYLMAIGLLLIFTNIVVPASLLQALTATSLSVGAMLGLVYFVRGPDADLFTLCAFIAGVSFVPLIVRFRAEKASRNAFLTELRDELKSAHLVALTKALAELADTDPLTGLRNRRSLSETLNGKWAEACARNDWFGVLMIDIDRFKLFNDTAGHEEGDRCLKQIASALLVETNRYGQYIARFGGEEFTAILSGLAQEPTLEVAESLRRTVEELAIPHPGGAKGSTVTISIGASVVRPSPHSSIEQIMVAADRALYEAKAGGRNRVAGGAASPDGPQRPLPVLP